MRIFTLLFLVTTLSPLKPYSHLAAAQNNKTQYSACTAQSPKVIARALRSIFSSLPHAIPPKSMKHIMQTPLEFLCSARAVLENTPEDILKLVDKQHSIGSYTPNDLTLLDHHREILTLNKQGLQLRAVVLAPLLTMVKDASKEGITLLISSTYRSYEYQKKVFARNVTALGEVRASRESARAGTSQHQLGLTIDFGCICPEFEKTSASAWLQEHAWEYGFSLSYPPRQEHITGYIFESWHYRYIGRHAAAFEKKYFAQGQQHVLELLQKRAQLLGL